MLGPIICLLIARNNETQSPLYAEKLLHNYITRTSTLDLGAEVPQRCSDFMQGFKFEEGYRLLSGPLRIAGWSEDYMKGWEGPAAIWKLISHTILLVQEAPTPLCLEVDAAAH